jgi:pre-mRNA branch site protein p14
MAAGERAQRLPPEVNRVLLVRNLPFSMERSELWHLFGKFGPVRQIRLGTAKNTRGSAFVVFDDVFDAKRACEHLSGFNVHNRYLIIVYHRPHKLNKKTS